jgi:hypothetical protein
MLGANPETVAVAVGVADDEMAGSPPLLPQLTREQMKNAIPIEKTPYFSFIIEHPLYR